MLMQNIPNPDYMHGTLGIDDTKVGRFALESSLDGYGQDSGDLGMGTTGSLGVSMVAPYTRGGFPGELFDSQPMPTGHWKDAPTPVMLGTDDGSQGTILSPITKFAIYAGLALLAYMVLKPEEKPVSVTRRSARPRPLLRTQRISSANK